MFASLPQEVRIAHVMRIIYASDPMLALVGRSLGAVFILKNIQGLPDVVPTGQKVGIPAQEWFETQTNKSLDFLTRRLPTSYFNKEAAYLRRAVSKYGDVGELALVDWLTRFMSGGSQDVDDGNGGFKKKYFPPGWPKLQEGVALAAALSYCKSGIEGEALNAVKRNKTNKIHNNRNPSLDDRGDDDRPMDPADSGAAKPYDMVGWHNKAPWKIPEVRKILETKVHKDAPLFLDLLEDGHNMTEIVGGASYADKAGMLPNYDSTTSYWQRKYMPLIAKVFKNLGLQEQALDYLDRRNFV
jgi:hypothetical protein